MLYRSQNPILFSIVTSPLIEYPEKGSNKYFLLTRNLKDRVQRQFPELTINYISPDTLFFEMSDVIKQRKIVKPIIDISFDQQYALTNRIIAVPDCVELTGPKAILDTIKFVETKPQSFQAVNKIFQAKMQLKPITSVVFNTPKITVVVPVDKYTESDISIPIEAKNLPSEFQMKTFPSSVKVTYKVTLDKFKYIKQRQFKIIADYNNLGEAFNNKIKIELDKAPSFIWDVNFKPKTVEFILERK